MTSPMKCGRVVAANDEWTLSDKGFGQTPDAKVFATNVASWFTGDRPGRFLVYSSNFGLNQASFRAAMAEAGHTLVTKAEFAEAFTAENLAGFDGVWLAGDAADNQVLIDYVEAGGGVYVAAGTKFGVSGPAGEAAKWAALMDHCELGFADAYNGVNSTMPVSSTHPVFADVSSLYVCGGNNISLTNTNSRISTVVSDHVGRGLFAMTNFARRHGKLVVANDEWTLSDRGFNRTVDTRTFATNVASWFTGGRPGRFLVYSSNFGLNQASFRAAMAEAGHTLVTKAELAEAFTAENLAGFDGVWLAGDAADNQVLIDYVEAGGSVYVAAGTKFEVSGPAGEAAKWAALVNHFDLDLADAYNGVDYTMPVSSTHPVFAGVGSLYVCGGNNISLTNPASTVATLAVDHMERGLFAVADLSSCPA